MSDLKVDFCRRHGRSPPQSGLCLVAPAKLTKRRREPAMGGGKIGERSDCTFGGRDGGFIVAAEIGRERDLVQPVDERRRAGIEPQAGREGREPLLWPA